MGPTARPTESFQKHICSPATHELSWSYQHSSSPCLLSCTQRHPGSYPCTQEITMGRTIEKPYNCRDLHSVFVWKDTSTGTVCCCSVGMYREGAHTWLWIKAYPQDPSVGKERRPRKQLPTQENHQHHIVSSIALQFCSPNLLFPSLGYFHFSFETGGEIRDLCYNMLLCTMLGNPCAL